MVCAPLIEVSDSLSKNMMTAETTNNAQPAETENNAGPAETNGETMNDDARGLVAHYFLAICNPLSCDTPYPVSPYPLNFGSALILQRNKGFSRPTTPHFMAYPWASVLLLIWGGFQNCFHFRTIFRKRRGVQKSMGNKVPWKIGMPTCLPVTSQPLISLQKEAVLSPCNFATTHLTACILNFYLP